MRLVENLATTVKLLEIRDQAKVILGDKWPAESARIQATIHEHCAKLKCAPLDLVLKVGPGMMEESPRAFMVMVAAVVDMIEASGGGA